MMRLPDLIALRTAVREAAERPEVADAVAAIHEDLAARIAERQPICKASGRCCRFDEFGHRLYITTLELAAFLRALRHEGLSIPTTHDLSGCAFQVGGLCGVHAIRPFGCRIFFCDPTADEWQTEQYEHFHRRLKELHELLEVPYAYPEWRQALREVLAPLSDH